MLLLVCFETKVKGYPQRNTYPFLVNSSLKKTSPMSTAEPQLLRQVGSEEDHGNEALRNPDPLT